MVVVSRRWRIFLFVSVLFVFTCGLLVRHDPTLIDRYRASAAAAAAAAAATTSTTARPVPSAPPAEAPLPPVQDGQPLRLTKLPDRFPVASFKTLPDDVPEGAVPAIQKTPAPPETPEAQAVRKARRAAVKASFERSWHGYKNTAWMADEVAPLSGGGRQDYDRLGGWAATLVDSLDTLWILGLRDEFAMAVRACEGIDFGATAAETISVFEVTIRYLGGFLSAHELSGGAHPVLLQKALEVGELLLGAFDTPNRLPLVRWDWHAYARGGLQAAAGRAVPSAELGSLSLEFTKLTQLTGDPRFYDAVQRIADVLAAHQHRTRLPGMWPVVVDAATPAFADDRTFSLGARADSLYELLPKQWLLLGGALEQPRRMYEAFLPVAKKRLFRRVLNAQNVPLVLPGDAAVVDDALTGHTVVHTPHTSHLACFAGGMVGLAARAFGGSDDDHDYGRDMQLAAELTDACVWAYNATTTGVGPERFYYVPCGSIDEAQAGFVCSYHEGKWRKALQAHWQINSTKGPDDPLERLVHSGRLAPGLVDIDDPRYLLRPEAIESVFVMWRLTGDPAWQDKAWHMFQRIARYTGAPAGTGQPGQVAAAGLDDVTKAAPALLDRAESFWLGETLKYFYLVFADWDTVSLDTWVFSTEAHPLRRAVHKAQRP